jgi:hypothetical protein
MRTCHAFAAALVVAAAGVAASAAPLPDSAKPPKRSPPTLLPVAAADLSRDGGVVTYVRHVTVNVPVQVNRTFEKDGRKVVTTVTEYRAEFRVETVAFRLGSYDLLTADGKPLPQKEAARRVAPGALLLVCWDGQLPEPAYLKLFKPDTLVLVARPKPGEPGGAEYPVEGKQPAPGTIRDEPKRPPAPLPPRDDNP